MLNNRWSRARLTQVRRPRGDKADGADGAEAAVEKGPPPEDGMVYRECAIKGIHTFGVFVEVLPGYEGLVHISELDTKKVASVEKSGFVVGQVRPLAYPPSAAMAPNTSFSAVSLFVCLFVCVLTVS